VPTSFTYKASGELPSALGVDITGQDLRLQVAIGNRRSRLGKNMSFCRQRQTRTGQRSVNAAQTPNEPAAGRLLDEVTLDPRAAKLLSFLKKPAFIGTTRPHGENNP